MPINPQDAFVFGVCIGFIAVFPVALLLHFVFRAINHGKPVDKSYYDEYP